MADESALARPPGDINRANDYARTKTAISRRLYDRQRNGSPVTQVFPTVLVGPGVWSEGNSMAALITRFARGRVPGLVGSGEQIWNLIGVRDAARGHVDPRGRHA